MLRTHRTIFIAAAAFGALALAPTTGAAAPASNLPVRAPSTNSYVVEQGDTLIGIAQKVKVTLRDLLTVNDLTLTSLIYPGMRLTVPGATPTVSAATSTRTIEYRVKNGDSLYGIALNLHVTVRSLLDSSGLRLDSVIYPGMRIQAPASATVASTNSSGAAGVSSSGAVASGSMTYVVRSGDYLSGIAIKHGVTLRQLLTANNLTVASVVHPGRVLALPANARPPVQPVVESHPVAASATLSKVERVVAYAVQQQGKPYRFFSAGPDYFDCSGLTKAAYAQVGITLTHQSAAQSTHGVAVDWTTEPIRAGDLVFMYSSNNTDVISHVGMAISSTMWIQAPRANDVVRVGPLPASSRILAVRRIIQP